MKAPFHRKKMMLFCYQTFHHMTLMGSQILFKSVIRNHKKAVIAAQLQTVMVHSNSCLLDLSTLLLLLLNAPGLDSC